MMADSGAARQHRYRLHTAGDHSECRDCDGAAACRTDADQAEPVTDPARELAALAGRLVAAHTADPANSTLAKELRATLLAMSLEPVKGEDEVDRIRQSWEDNLNGL